MVTLSIRRAVCLEPCEFFFFKTLIIRENLQFIQTNDVLWLFRTPAASLKPQDFDESSNGPYRPQIGMARHNQRANIQFAGHRMLG